MMIPKLLDDVLDAGEIDPKALAATLRISMSELAELVGVSRNTLSTEPLGKKGRDALTPLVRLLSQAAEMAGTEDRAVVWFKYTPIVSMGTKTAMEHVKDGNAGWVQGHLRNVYNGVYA
ncbi:hypothetical protein RM533_09370 [Croceicoccus sp. F390]|uniref:XRE family transcriptional regulator n=1 Tax=Croceicoccus esteveae TaxID=3075597 RepID=A0ABU2ZJJ8_9SPHN|nr:hypothetical protein [Croceicoccus sp. F390]MDT0576396.1 hypothetical protein [Croceicoccus sp. F390]